jgi:hypothetical protein
LIKTYPTVYFYKRRPQKVLDCKNFTCSNIDDFTIQYPENFNILYNLKNEGKDISMFKSNYVKQRNEWVQDLTDDYKELKDTFANNEYKRSLFLCHKMLANMKIINSLSEVFEKKILYTSKSTNHLEDFIKKINTQIK